MWQNTYPGSARASAKPKPICDQVQTGGCKPNSNFSNFRRPGSPRVHWTSKAGWNLNAAEARCSLQCPFSFSYRTCASSAFVLEGLLKGTHWICLSKVPHAMRWSMLALNFQRRYAALSVVPDSGGVETAGIGQATTSSPTTENFRVCVNSPAELQP